MVLEETSASELQVEQLEEVLEVGTLMVVLEAATFPQREQDEQEGPKKHSGVVEELAWSLSELLTRRRLAAFVEGIGSGVQPWMLFAEPHRIVLVF